MTSTRKDRRVRRLLRCRREIMAAAAPIFAAQGYANTTIKAIAEAVDMAEGTLYNYFENKRDILIAIAETAQADVDALLDDVMHLEGRSDMVDLVERGLQWLLARLPFIRAVWMEAWVDDDIFREYAAERLRALHQRVEAFIADHINAGVFRPVDPAIAAQMVLGMFFAPILPVMRGVVPPPSPEECRALAEMAVDLMLDGIRIPVVTGMKEDSANLS